MGHIGTTFDFLRLPNFCSSFYDERHLIGRRKERPFFCPFFHQTVRLLEETNVIAEVFTGDAFGVCAAAHAAAAARLRGNRRSQNQHLRTGRPTE